MRSKATAIIVTRQENSTLCEAFEVPPSRPGLEWKTRELLIRSYPALTVEIPNEVFDDGGFQLQLANVFSHPNVVNSDLPFPHGHINELFSSFYLARDGPHAATQRALLASALHGVDRTADVLCITKRIHDYSILESNEIPSPWRRSPLWLLIRVAIQMSDNRSLGRGSYKRFILFFMCTLAKDENNATLSSDLLHLMSSKILRRLSKLGFSTPHWLSEMLLKTGSRLNKMLDAGRERLNLEARPFINPSRDQLARDTQLSLVNCGEYIQNALTNLGHEAIGTPFHPNHRPRGTIEDFLASNGTFFDKAYGADPDGTLYDVEQSVEQSIDDWLVRVTNVDEACVQLEILMDEWVMKSDLYREGPEGASNRFLTSIELFVALDKLVVKEIPMLADYSPEIPITALERLLLRRATSLHRLSRAYQYLSLRHSRSRPGWSLLSDEFTEDSFPVRYYDQSPHLQQLKVRIEQDAVEKLAAHADWHLVRAIPHSSVAETKNSTRIPQPDHRCLHAHYMRKSLYSSCNAQRMFVSGVLRCPVL